MFILAQRSIEMQQVVAGFFVDAALFARIASGGNAASEMENTLKRARVVSEQRFSALALWELMGLTKFCHELHE